MNDIEYILRVILRARDELTSKLAKARAELEAFAKSSRKLDRDLDGLNKRLTGLNTRIGNSTKKVQEWQSAIRSFSREADKADKASASTAKNIEAIARESDKSARKVRDTTKAQREFTDAIEKTNRQYTKLQQQFVKQKVSNDDYVRDLERIEKAYNRLSDKADVGSKLSRSLRAAGREAKDFADDITRIEKNTQEAAKAAEKKALADKASAAATRELSRRERELGAEVARVESAFTGRARKSDEYRASIRRLSSEYSKLSREHSHTSREARKLGTEAERLNSEFKKLSSSTGGLIGGFRGMSSSIAQLDNNLRGIGLLAAFAASQQLMTGVIALGGELVALAGSAAMAGAALGGMATAGVAQALPAIGLLTAALVRAKGVMDAVTQAQNLQKQQFVQGEKASRAQADGIDQIANAQDSLRDAHQRVAEAAQGVTDAQENAAEATRNVAKAQKDARRELEDMILAQKEAALAAKGAALSEDEARAALAKAIQEGGDVRRAQLTLQESQLQAQGARREARRGAVDTRRAVAGGVEGMEGVRQARKAAEDAQGALEKARQAAQDAEEGVVKAERGLERARRSAAEAVAGTQTARAQLDFMLSQMSDAERAMYSAVRRFQLFMQTGFRGITDIIVGSFTHGINRAVDVLKQPEVLNEARKLASTIRKQFDRITDAFTSQPMIDQFLRITEAGRKNLKPLADIAISLGKSFGNIAEEAGPALENFIGFVGDLVDKFSGLTGDKDKMTDFFLDGEKHLEAWINLAVSFINLFAAITGAGGADEGKRSIEEATDAINDFADKIRENEPKVRKFFDDVHDVVKDIIEVAIALGKEIAKTFNARHFDALKNIFVDVLIPALGELVRTVSFLTNIFITFLDLPFVREFAKWGFVVAGFIFMTGGAVKATIDFAKRVVYLWDVFKFVGPKIIGLVKNLAGVIGRYAVIIGRSLYAALGPGGLVILAITALIAIVILLDKKFHFLGPTFRFIKRVAGDVFDWLKDAVRSVVRFVGKHWDLILAILVGPLGLAVRYIIRHWRQIKEAFKDGIDGVVDFMRKLPGRIKGFAESAAKTIINAFKNVGESILKGIVGGLKDVGGFAKDIANAFIDLLNRLLPNKLSVPGAPDINLPDNPIPHLAAGGPVPGSGSGDIVPAMLTPGEHVWTAAEVRAAGGHSAMFALRAFFGGGTQSTGSGMANGGAPIPRPLGQSGLQDAAPVIEKDRQNIKRSNDQRARDWRVMWNDMVATARRGANDIEKQMRDMRVNGTSTLRRLRTDWSKIWGDAWQNVADFAFRSLNYVGHEANRALTAFGAKHIDFGLNKTNIRGAASGGWIGVPGERGRDMVPTWLGRGEAVLNWAHQRYIAPAVEAYYGHPFEKTFDRVHGMHAGGKGDAIGFAGGGLTGPKGTGAAFTAIANFAKNKFGLDLSAGRTDHGYLTSSGNVSDHTWGGAGDFSNGYHTPQENAFNAFWLHKAPQVIKQLIWEGKDQQRGFPIPDHFDHVHLAVKRELAFDLPRMAKIISRASRGLDIGSLMSGVTDADGTSVADHIDKITVKGVEFAKNLFQKLLDKVITAGNAKIDKEFSAHTPSAGGGPASIPLSTGGTAAKVFNYFVDRGLGDVVAAGIAGTFQKESGFSTSVFNKAGSGAFGLAQWLGGRLTALKQFGGDDYTSLQKQLDFVWHELTGSESGALSAVRRAKTPEEAATIFDKVYERSDGLLSAPQYARAIFNAFEQHAEGGIVGGGEGQPTPIIAHAGEWVLNKGQQARAAMFAGTSIGGLRAMLGFGSSGSGMFQDGGEVRPLTGPLHSVKMAEIADRSLRHAFVLLRQMTDKMAANLKTGVVETFSVRIRRVLDGLEDASKQLDRVKRADRRRGIDRFLKVVTDMTGEGGLFDRLRGAIELRAARAQRALVRARFQVGAGRVVTERQTAAEQAQNQLEAAQGLQANLVGETGQISRALRRVRRQQRRGGLTQEQRQQLATRAKELQNRLDDAQQRVADNIQAMFEAQITAQQAQVDEITKRYERKSASNEIQRRLATMLGDEDWLVRVNEAQRDILTGQANELEKRISLARAAGATELADDLTAQVEDLRTQIRESLQQEIKDAADRITANMQRRQGHLDLAGRLLDALGTIGLGGVGGGGAGTPFLNSLLQQQGITGGFSRAGLLQARGATMQTAYGGLQTQLGLAQQQGNLGLIKDLTDQLAELEVAIAENTQAQFQAKVDEIQARSGYTLGINDLNRQILELTGQISGNTDVVGLLALANERDAVLRQKDIDLRALWAQTQPGTKQYEDLQQAVLENQVALLQNTQSINELNGTMRDPQGFSSTAWTQFREAIFTGMGQILPQYDIFPTAQTGGIAARAGLYRLHPGELIKPAGTWNSNSTMQGDVNITVNGIEGKVDPTAIASAVAFAKKTSQ